MAAYQCTPDEAFDRLQTQSQDTKLDNAENTARDPPTKSDASTC